jgi:trk system potassium uptake protein TrkH
MKQLMKNFNNIGKLMIIIGLLICVPIFIVPFFPSNHIYILDFLVPAAISIILGLIIGRSFKSNQEKLVEIIPQQHDGIITVLFAWGYGFLIGGIPFILSGQLNFLQGLYESVSGWTTTGLSVMDVTVTPPIFLFYRSFMQFCGGLGFIMMMVMVIQEKDSMSLYEAEGHSDRIMPNIRKTAQVIFLIYSLFLVVGTSVYTALGMPLFDSLLHTMSALSTGGFSSEPESIGAYGSISIEAFTILLMLIGTTNFAILLLLINRKLKQVAKISELRFLSLLLIILIPLTMASLFFSTYLTAGESFRHATFNIVSALSTTGYSSISYEGWSHFSIGIVIIAMLIGGGLGSTAGAIKLTRVYILMRVLGSNIRKRMSSSRRVSQSYYYTAQGKQSLDSSLVLDTFGFVLCYLIIFIIGSLAITWTANVNLSDGMFEFASSLGTVGLSIGLTGPTTDGGTLIVQMIGMILGRLEIFIVLIGIYSAVSNIRNKINI